MFRWPKSDRNEKIKENLIIKEHNSSKYFFSITRGSFKGESSILILVMDSQSTARAKKWAKAISRLTKAHVKTVKTIDYSFEIESYIKEHKIRFLFILDFNHDRDESIISAKNDSVQSFLTKSFLINRHPFTFIASEAEKYFHALTTEVKIGKNVDARKLIDFFLSIIELIPKLSLADNESHIFTKSSHKVKPSIPYNRVELNPKLLKQYDFRENDNVIIYNPFTHLSTVACLKSSPKSGLDEINISPSISNKIGLTQNGQIVFHPLKKVVGENIVIQNVNKLADGAITVSDDIYQMIETFGADHFEIISRATGSSLDIERTKIHPSSSSPDGTIKLSYLQREFLGLEHPPDTLSPYYMELFLNKLENQNDKDFLNAHYANEKVHEIDTFEERKKAKGIFKKVGYYQAAIYPIYGKRTKKKMFFLKRIFFLLLRWVIRPANLKLKVIRPYSTDESSNIVRISKNVMSLLGIEENDLIKINYRGRSVSVPVLGLDSAELIEETNIVSNKSSINISIGIPAHLRAKLGIKQIGKVCDVERDLVFLLRKNLYIQFLPILAAIFGISSLGFLPIWLKITLSICMVPLTSYIILSSVREKIPKLGDKL